MNPRALIQKRFVEWLDRRLPETRLIQLDHRSIFIFPSSAGLVFLMLLVVLLIAAINYQNNMLYAFTFLAGAVFAVSIIHCYRNLSGLQIGFTRSTSCFPGQEAWFSFSVQRVGRHPSEMLALGWPGHASAQGRVIPGELLELQAAFPAERRGILKPGRLLVQSSYPFGLVRAWTWLSLGAKAVVYPKPIEASQLPHPSEGQEEGNQRPVAGLEDYQGLRDFYPGDSLRHVAWKQFARKDELYTKEFALYLGESDWLDLRDYPGAPLELVLSYLCERVLRLSRQQQPFGLRLGSQEIPPNTGEAHREKCLAALALYGQASENPPVARRR